MTLKELEEIKKRATFCSSLDFYHSSVSDLIEYDVPTLIAEIERLTKQLEEKEND